MGVIGVGSSDSIPKGPVSIVVQYGNQARVEVMQRPRGAGEITKQYSFFRSGDVLTASEPLPSSKPGIGQNVADGVGMNGIGGRMDMYA